MRRKSSLFIKNRVCFKAIQNSKIENLARKYDEFCEKKTINTS